jgi:hypothetical protein
LDNGVGNAVSAVDGDTYLNVAVEYSFQENQRKKEVHKVCDTELWIWNVIIFSAYNDMFILDPTSGELSVSPTDFDPALLPAGETITLIIQVQN